MFGFLKITFLLGISFALILNSNISNAKEADTVPNNNSASEKSQILTSKNQKDFIKLEYMSIKPNKVDFLETPFCSVKVVNTRCKKEDKLLNLSIDIKNSASPLFYKVNKKVKKIEVSGEIKVISPIESLKDDSYLQVGLIYEGDYRANFITKFFLPKWLREVLNLFPNKGINEDIYFYEASEKKQPLNKTSIIKKVKLHFNTSTYIIWQKNKKPLTGLFNIKISPIQKNILGLWIRSDGDDSKAAFNTTVTNFTIE